MNRGNQMKEEQDNIPDKPNEQQTLQSLPPKIREIVTAHLEENPTLTSEEVLEEIRAAGFY
jgi:hypothetical protein